jgi:hypothetical protein
MEFLNELSVDLAMERSRPSQWETGWFLAENTLFTISFYLDFFNGIFSGLQKMHSTVCRHFLS